MTPSQPNPSLPWHQRWSYGLPAFALAVVGIPVYVHIPKFYTDVVGINIAWVGSILMLARLFDAFSDPLMGVVSDRTRTRMGRRRPFILWGSICLATTIFLLFVPPHLKGMPALIWFAGSIFGLFFFWTVVTVPYEALGPALTKDYTERTSLFAVRDGLLIAGRLERRSVGRFFRLPDLCFSVRCCRRQEPVRVHRKSLPEERGGTGDEQAGLQKGQRQPRCRD